MQDLVDRLVRRPCLQQARLAGNSVRNAYHRNPDDVMAGLASWSAHPSPFVRIASGVAYGVIGARDRDSLTRILPFVERLANDADPEVREHGAEGALEELWLAHADALWTVLEQWLQGKNDRVREVVIRTVARIAVGGKISRPSLLRRFIERGLELYDALVPGASPTVVATLTTAVDGMGCLAPEVVTPFVRRCAERDDASSLSLVLDVARTPFGSLCEGVDFEDAGMRLGRMRHAAETDVAGLVNQGVGDVEHLSLMGTSFLVRQMSDHLPWTWIADPYRGCQMRCTFCNARTGDEWSGDSAEKFRRRVTVVQNAPQLAAMELRNEELAPRVGNVLGIGVTSDPYQPGEERHQVTRELLKACLESGHPVVVQTRQALILRDVDLLEMLAKRDLVNVYVALQAAEDDVRARMEPDGATVAERLRVMRVLSSRGVPVALLLSPVMPEVTDDLELLGDTLRRAKDAGASWVTAEVLNLHGSARAKVRLFLESQSPAMVDTYRALYTAGARPGDPDPAYERCLLEETLPELARQHGLVQTARMLTSGRDPQLCLVRR